MVNRYSMREQQTTNFQRTSGGSAKASQSFAITTKRTTARWSADDRNQNHKEFAPSLSKGNVAMIKILVIASVVSAAMIGTNWSFAQEPTPTRTTQDRGLDGREPRFGGSGPASVFLNLHPTLSLFNFREVRMELKLEEDQAKKIDEINAEVARERVRINTEINELNAKLSEIRKKAEAETLGLLSDAQRRRTEQLKLQQQGWQAFSTTQVEEKLGLTKEQIAEIARFDRLGFSFGRGSGFARYAPNQTIPAAERYRQRVEETNQRAVENREEILSILTPEQRAKWSEMTGEPFKFPATPLRSGTRDPRGTQSTEPPKPDTSKKDQ